MTKKLQIAIIGPAGKLSTKQCMIAEQLAAELSKHDVILLYSHEGDVNSIPQMVATNFINHNGIAIGFLWNGSEKSIIPGITIDTGQERGGGREFSFIKSSDVVLAVGGGSGTLMEISMAYQAHIPIVALTTINGWSKKLAGTFLDTRKVAKIHAAKTVQSAVTQAIAFAKKKPV